MPRSWLEFTKDELAEDRNAVGPIKRDGTGMFSSELEDCRQSAYQTLKTPAIAAYEPRPIRLITMHQKTEIQTA